MARFRAHVVRGTDHSHSKLILSRVTQHLRNTKVTYLYRVVTRQEQILRFYVPMDNLLGVEVLEAEGRLHQPVEDVGFWDLLLVLYLALDLEGKVTDCVFRANGATYLHNTP